MMMFSVLAQTYTDRLFEVYLEQLASPGGAAVLLLGVIAAGLVLSFDASKWVLLSCAIYLATSSIKRNDLFTPLPFPFSTIGEVSQGVVIGLIGLLAIAGVKQQPIPRAKLGNPTLFWMFAMGACVSARQMSGEYASKGVGGLVIYVVIYLVLGLGLGRWVYDEAQARKLVKAVSWSLGLFIIGSTLMLGLSWSAGFAGTRFMGTTPNPQRAGGLIGMTLPFCFALYADKNNTANSRLLHAAIAGFGIVALIMTGSRTGVLLAVVGATVFYRARIGSILLAVIAVGAFLLIGYLVVGDAVSEGGEHLLSTDNTRETVWPRLIAGWLDSPWIGTPLEGAPGESSYLSVLVMAGIPGGLAIFGAVFTMARSAYKFVRQSSQLGSMGVYGDLAAASVAQMIIGWTFEAFALGTLTDHMLVIYCTFALIGFLLERLKSAHETSSDQASDDVFDEPGMRSITDLSGHAIAGGSFQRPAGQNH